MLNWIASLFNNSDPEADELDRRIAAADARIAAKQAYLEQLKTDVEEKKEVAKSLRDTVSRYEKAVKQREN